jgi:hypothetical protein
VKSDWRKMMRRLMPVLVLAVVLAGCGDDGGAEEGGGLLDKVETTTTERPTTTTTPASPSSCSETFSIGDPHDEPRECWEFMVRAVLDEDQVEYDADLVDASAASVCRAIDLADSPVGIVGVLADWETGAAPAPTEEHATFVALAVAVYCPQWFDQLQTIQ